VLLPQLDVLVKQTQVLFRDVRVFVFELFFYQFLLQLVGPDPGEELQSEFTTLKDRILEI
jgi:hypothetical protein